MSFVLIAGAFYSIISEMSEEVELVSFFESLLKRYHRENAIERVVSITETPLVLSGPNFMSVVKRIVATVALCSGKVTDRRLILKELPSGPVIREVIKGLGLFMREITCYSDVLPVFEDLLEKQGYPDEPLWPQCFDVEPHDRIILEDLEPLGYKSVRELRSLDFEHCVLAMQALGLFHSFSLLAKDHRVLNLDIFSKPCHYIRDNYLHDFSMALSKLVPVMRSWGDEWDSTADNILTLIPRVEEKLKSLLQFNETRLNVLNHGDFWKNNIMFKYNQYTGIPEKIRLIDFQLVHYNTPAMDLAFFLAFSPNLDVRRQHVDHLIYVYHQSLTFNMDRFQVNAILPSLGEIQDEIRRLGLFQFFLVLTLVPRAIFHEEKVEPFDREEFVEKKLDASLSDEEKINQWLDFGNQSFSSILKVALKQAMENEVFK